MTKKRKLKDRIKLGVLIFLLKIFFTIEKYLVTIKNINYPEGQFILAILHCHQCLIYGVKDKENFYALISASNDGEIVAKGIECLNLKSVRGSTKRRGVAASLELIDKLNAGASAAIMIDGPRGPRGKVKDGIVNISKITGVPIIPVVWGSKNKSFLEFNTWDKFRVPVGFCKTIALYGNPIHIPKDIKKEDMQEYCNQIENELNRLVIDLDENYQIYIKQ